MFHVRLFIALVAALLVMLVAGVLPATGASPGVGTITTFSDPSIVIPYGITAGPDGAMWFTNFGGSTIGRITTSGTVTFYSDPVISGPYSIAAGSDGALWFTNTGGNSIGRITTDGVVTSFSDPGIAQPREIAAGPDGALWFTNYGSGFGFPNGSIGRITTSGIVTRYALSIFARPTDIVAGPDGALWFIDSNQNTVGRISTAGAITTYASGGATAIASGPDDALWLAIGNYIGRLTTTGALTFFTDPQILGSQEIVAGQDGALWFTSVTGTIGRITTDRSVTIYGSADVVRPLGIARGPDGALWFTDYSFNHTIGRIQVVADVTPPTISAPHDIVADATSAAGAVVIYDVTATDDIDANPQLTCTPESGSTFPIGTTTVTCSAADSSGNTSSATFAVHVNGAPEQLQALAVALNEVGPGTSLTDKLAQVQAALAGSDTTTAASILRAFMNEVRAQEGRKLSADTAAALLESARRISSVLM